MSLVRKRVRLIVLVGTLAALFTLFGSTAVGAADFGYAGRLGGDFARGTSPTGGTGVSGFVTSTSGTTSVSGGFGRSSGSGGGGGTVSATGPSSFTGQFSSGISGVSGSGGAGSVSTFRNGR